MKNSLYCTSCSSYCILCVAAECQFCEGTLHLINGECGCPPAEGIAEESLRSCQTICGDGLKHSNEACDDGNSNNNDGCSTSCVVEEGWSCSGGNVTTSDTCYCNVSVQSAAFEEDWKQIAISFSRNISVISACEDIIAVDTLEKLGSSPNCTAFNNSRNLLITFGTLPSYNVVNDTISLIGAGAINYFAPQCSAANTDLSPSLLPFPSPSFSFSINLNNLDIELRVENLNVGSTVFTNYSLTYEIISPNDSNATAINTCLSSQNNSLQ